MNILKESLINSYSYQEYRELVYKLLQQNKSTAENDTQDLVGYSKLNHSRMKRLDKTISLSEELSAHLSGLNNKITWVVITEGWCGDAAQNIPIINKFAEASDKIELRLVLRDQNTELMKLFLTNGSQSIPKLIQIEHEEVTATWGPRPSIATKMISDYKAEHSKVDASIKKELQIWYNKNKGQNMISDLLELLNFPVETT